MYFRLAPQDRIHKECTPRFSRNWLIANNKQQFYVIGTYVLSY